MSTEDFFRTVIGSLPTGLVVFDEAGRIDCANPAAEHLLGMPAEDLRTDAGLSVLCNGLLDAAGGRVGVDHRSLVDRLRSGGRAGGVVVGVDRRDGTRAWLSTSWCRMEPADAGFSPLLVSFTDITAEHAASRVLSHAASHDNLTGLPNRAGMLARLAEARRRVDDEALCAVVFVDLDGFKSINDTLGHDAGDTAIKIAAERLRRGVRPQDMVARLGGDEFVAVLTGALSADDLRRLRRRLRALVSAPAVIDGVPVRLSASVGITALDPGDERSDARLLRDADAAMYRAKRREKLLSAA
jgi:diguanylate cyclase (GGDEF)-like protein/PAS domain S-box-containing protein